MSRPAKNSVCTLCSKNQVLMLPHVPEEVVTNIVSIFTQTIPKNNCNWWQSLENSRCVGAVWLLAAKGLVVTNIATINNETYWFEQGMNNCCQETDSNYRYTKENSLHITCCAISFNNMGHSTNDLSQRHLPSLKKQSSSHLIVFRDVIMPTHRQL